MWKLFLVALIGWHVRGQIEVDVAWNFDKTDDTSGWGNATASQSGIAVSSKNGNLVCSTTGTSPVLDSPSLFLEVSTRTFVVLRMSYLGVAQAANLLLRSSASPNSAQQLAFNTQYWSARQRMTIVSSTAGTTPNAMVDGDPTTTYEANSASAVEIIFDLGDFRQINALRLLPSGTTSSPKRCFLQRSITSGVGPFQTVTSFTGTFPVILYDFVNLII